MMLLGGGKPEIKQVAVVTRNQKVNRLLSCVLAEWKFFTVEDISQATVVFAEHGVDLPQGDFRVVWLTSMPLDGSFLEVPISLTRLYHLLEIHFFPTPRRHIRVAMGGLVDLKINEAWFVGQLLSISDRGCRMSCDNEISRGTTITVEMVLGGKTYRTPADVLYCIPAGDSPERHKPQVGVLFRPTDEQQYKHLRAFIEKTCVERACLKENIRLSDPSVSWMDVTFE